MRAFWRLQALTLTGLAFAGVISPWFATLGWVLLTLMVSSEWVQSDREMKQKLARAQLLADIARATSRH